MKHNITIQSVGGYSSWCYYKPIRVLFDCGEGLATDQLNYVFQPQHLFFSHFHMDHISGLLQFLKARLSARGNKDKEICIHYLDSRQNRDRIVDICKIVGLRGCQQIVDLQPFKHGDDIPIKDKKVRTFPMKHGKITSTGFCVIEHRSKLADEFRDLHSDEIKNLSLKGVNVKQQFNHPIFMYCLDNYSYVIQKWMEGVDYLIEDANFLVEQDRNKPKHKTIYEAYSTARDLKAKNVILAHVSSRYFGSEKNAKVILPDTPSTKPYIIRSKRSVSID